VKGLEGKVYLVGAGPGSPGLITLKGIEVLKKADVVLYDRLVHPYLLNFAPKARKIYCGKNPSKHVWDQERINAVLIEEAKKGNVVVRLKGGDPFIFGRGGEEVLALSSAHIPFEVIPGVSSAIGVPSSLGIPLTHRGKSSTLAIVTGRQDPTSPNLPIDWESVSSFETIVILMGVKALPEIVEKILKKKPPKTPVTIITWGTFPQQKVVKGTLSDIVEKSKREKVKPPSIIIVGEVVNLSRDLLSFKNFPCLGWKSFLIGSFDKVGDFGRRLIDLGFEVEICDYKREISDSLWNIINKLDSFNWLIFKDSEAVEGFLLVLKKKRYDLRNLSNLKLGVMTKEAFEDLKKVGLFPDRAFLREERFPEKTLVISSYESEDASLKATEVCAFKLTAASSMMKRISRYKRVDFTFLLSPSGISILSEIPRNSVGMIFALPECASPLVEKNYSFIEFNSFSEVEEFLYDYRLETLKEVEL
jgi:uroporphyrinogen III methyltransferase/synthase